jgi:hypothetical protein
MQKSPFLTIVIVSAALAACAAPTQSGPRGADALGLSRTAPSPVWRVPTQLDLALKHGVDISAWRCSYAPDGVVLMESLATEAVGNALLLVGGHALAVRGAMPPRRDVLEIVDDVMLNQQLATRLLQQGLPQGPESVTSTQHVQVDESSEPVGTETTNTSRNFYPPWKLRGDARRVTADSIAFDLQFDAQASGTAARAEHYSLSGIWQQRTPAPRIADDFSLLGWSIYRIRMGTRDAGGITIASYVTTPDSRRYQTLGELRAALPTGR